MTPPAETVREPCRVRHLAKGVDVPCFHGTGHTHGLADFAAALTTAEAEELLTRPFESDPRAAAQAAAGLLVVLQQFCRKGRPVTDRLVYDSRGLAEQPRHFLVVALGVTLEYLRRRDGHR